MEGLGKMPINAKEESKTGSLTGCRFQKEKQGLKSVFVVRF
jgi:hypothetical protein